MEKRYVFANIVFALAIIVAVSAIMLLFSNRENNALTGSYVIGGEQAAPQAVGQDVIEIRKDDLTKCCSFKNALSAEDACYVMKNKDCSYCQPYCA